MDNQTNLVTAKVYAETLRWIKREQHRLWEETGKEPTVADLIAQAIQDAQKLRDGEVFQTAKESHGELDIPASMMPLVEWLLDMFKGKGSAEEEIFKDTARLLAERRSRDLKKSRKKD